MYLTLKAKNTKTLPSQSFRHIQATNNIKENLLGD